MGIDEEQGRSKKPGLRIGAIVATVAAIVGIATGVLTLRDQLRSDDQSGSTNTGQSEPREIPRYDGVAGHLSEGRALLDFLDQHNRESVYLDVGFPDHLGIPGGPTDNVASLTEPYKGGTRHVITEVALMTECDSDIPPDNTNPTPGDSCKGTGLLIDGPETEDTQTFFEHGVPRFKGYFAVDVTGALHQGITPINLKPLTFDQARGE
jgi:hypothetical protein